MKTKEMENGWGALGFFLLWISFSLYILSKQTELAFPYI